MTIIASMHQPNYAPWLGYFHKMTYSDLFIFLDAVQYTPKTYTNRCMISQAGQAVRLSIPVNLDNWDASIFEVRIETQKFARKHLANLRHAYGKCQYYDDVMAVVEQCYDGTATNLAEFNMNLIKAVVGYLEFPIRFIKLSELDLNSHKNQLLIDIAKACDIDLFISGAGAKAYIEGSEEDYRSAGIRLGFQNFVHPQYRQRHKNFVDGCSILDLIFNHGPNAREILSQQDEPPYLEWEP